MMKSQAGSSLIALCLLIVVASGAGVYLMQLYDSIDKSKAEITTFQKEQDIKQALEDFFMRNGRYPCPAPLDARIDTPDFGFENPDPNLGDGYQCEDAPLVGASFEVAGRAGRDVRVGTVPVRSLGLPDKHIYDEFGTRFVYAVTEIFANDYLTPGEYPQNNDNGAIFLNDSDGNSITAIPGSAIYTLMSKKGDPNGAFAKNGGAPVGGCTLDGSLSAQNCDFMTGAGDAVFQVSSFKSNRDDNYFMQDVGALLASRPCTEQRDDWGDVTFLIDSSGSMRANLPSASCPPETGNNCNRIEVARWAMRRIMPQVVAKDFATGNGTGPNADQIKITRFVGGVGTDPNAVLSGMGNIEFDPTFDDPDLGPQSDADFERIQDAINQEMNFCPSGMTPLGQNIQALAQDTNGNVRNDWVERDGTSTARKNKVIVLSDGRHNGGNTWNLNNTRAAVEGGFPNAEVDIIDMSGNFPELADAVTEDGNFYSAADPLALIEAFEDALGLCVNPTDTFDDAAGLPCERPG
ncbi:MAG: vWA domain-containing protein [Pseudomonadota bacterium]